MLTIYGNKDRSTSHCDGLNRRNFIKIGGMAAGGLSLSQLLAAEAQAGTGNSHKAIINVFLPGGPSHIDLFDLKPDAPAEVRGEFSPIRTNVPGMEISEVFPLLAQQADKFTIIRSIADADGRHDGYQCMTGHKRNSVSPAWRLAHVGVDDFQVARERQSSDPRESVVDVSDAAPRLGNSAHGGLRWQSSRSHAAGQQGSTGQAGQHDAQRHYAREAR